MKPNVVRVIATSCPCCKYVYSVEERFFVDYKHPITDDVTDIRYPRMSIQPMSVLVGYQPFQDVLHGLIACPRCGVVLNKDLVQTVTESLISEQYSK